MHAYQDNFIRLEKFSEISKATPGLILSNWEYFYAIHKAQLDSKLTWNETKQFWNNPEIYILKSANFKHPKIPNQWIILLSVFWRRIFLFWLEDFWKSIYSFWIFSSYIFGMNSCSSAMISNPLFPYRESEKIYAKNVRSLVCLGLISKWTFFVLE